MNVEWWGGEQSSPPCRLQVGAPPRPGSAAGGGLFGQRMACGAYYTASETLALPGHRASLSSSVICVHLWLNDALV